MKLEENYFHSMDRKFSKDYLISPTTVGVSANPMKDLVQGTKARIFQGAKHIELGFSGRGKGSMGQGSTTPEMYGQEEREAIRDMAKINDATLSTHATFSVGNFSGFHDGRFDEQAREQNIFEAKRALEFAADTAEGGPVVIHTGEFPREISDAPSPKTQGIKGEFMGYQEEPVEKLHVLVDSRTGKIIDTIKENQVNFVPQPKFERDTHGNVLFNPDGTPKVKMEKKFGRDVPAYELDSAGSIVIQRRDWGFYKGWAEKNREVYPNADDTLYPEQSHNAAKLFFYDNLRARKLQSEGQADEYESHYRPMLEAKGRAEKALKLWQEIEKKVPDNEQARAEWEKTMKSLGRLGGELIPPKEQSPVDYIKDRIWEIDRYISYGKEIGAGARAQMKEYEDMQKRAVPAGDYAIKKTADSIGRAGIFAMNEQGKKKLSQDLFVAPENIFPEQGYGSHPEELKNIIVKSRDRMVELMTNPKAIGETSATKETRKWLEQQKQRAKDENMGEAVKRIDEKLKSLDSRTEFIKNPYYRQGMSKSEAKNLAERHIKATFDIGHANTWRKYFTGKPEEFKKWLMKQVGELAKDKILGHVHITDNFGYYDDHVNPGHGNAPIKEFVSELKKKGYGGKITLEPAHQDIKMMTEGWRTLNSPIYRIDGASRTWTDIQYGYFGRTHSPRYIFGDLAPDPKTWTMWSEVPLE